MLKNTLAENIKKFEQYVHKTLPKLMPQETPTKCRVFSCEPLFLLLIASQISVISRILCNVVTNEEARWPTLFLGTKNENYP